MFYKMFRIFYKEANGKIVEYVILLGSVGVLTLMLFPDLKGFIVETFDQMVVNVDEGLSGDNNPTEPPGQQESTPLPPMPTPSQYSLRFDGSTYIQLPDTLSSLGKGTNDFTFEGWFNVENSDKTYYFAKNSDEGFNNLILGQFTDQGTYSAHITKSDGPTQDDYNSSIPSTKNQRVHLAYVIKDNVLTLYQNGSSIWSTPIETRSLWDDTKPPQLGMDLDHIPNQTEASITDFYIGIMYEVRLYNRALSENEVLNNMNGMITSNQLSAEYLFNNGPGATYVSDSSGNGNHATIVGNSVWVEE